MDNSSHDKPMRFKGKRDCSTCAGFPEPHFDGLSVGLSHGPRGSIFGTAPAVESRYEIIFSGKHLIGNFLISNGVVV